MSPVKWSSATIRTRGFVGFAWISYDSPAVVVSWDEAERILGRQHDGMLGDDLKIAAAVREAGGPAWVTSGAFRRDSAGWWAVNYDETSEALPYFQPDDPGCGAQPTQP